MVIRVGLILSRWPTNLPLLHLQLHVDPLFVQQLSLGERPVHRLHGGLGARGPLPLHASLLWVVEAEHVALPQDDAVSCGRRRATVTRPEIHISHIRLKCTTVPTFRDCGNRYRYIARPKFYFYSILEHMKNIFPRS